MIDLLLDIRRNASCKLAMIKEAVSPAAVAAAALNRAKKQTISKMLGNISSAKEDGFEAGERLLNRLIGKRKHLANQWDSIEPNIFLRPMEEASHFSPELNALRDARGALNVFKSELTHSTPDFGRAQKELARIRPDMFPKKPGVFGGVDLSHGPFGDDPVRANWGRVLNTRMGKNLSRVRNEAVEGFGGPKPSNKDLELIGKMDGTDNLANMLPDYVDMPSNMERNVRGLIDPYTRIVTDGVVPAVSAAAGVASNIKDNAIKVAPDVKKALMGLLQREKLRIDIARAAYKHGVGDGGFPEVLLHNPKGSILGRLKDAFNSYLGSIKDPDMSEKFNTLEGLMRDDSPFSGMLKAFRKSMLD